MAARLGPAADDIRRALGSTALARLAEIAGQESADQVAFSAQHWSKATIRLLAKYVRSRDRGRKARLARASVPVLEAGILAFLNLTYCLSYEEAFRRLDAEYLPVFRRTWDSLSRRLILYRLALLRRWPMRAATRIVNALGLAAR
jgi:hypothetical protein